MLGLVACSSEPSGPEWIDLLVPARETPELCAPDEAVMPCVEARWEAYRDVLKRKQIPRGTDALLCLVMVCAKRDKQEQLPSADGVWRRACAAYTDRTPWMPDNAPLQAGDCHTSAMMTLFRDEVE